jgi:hypothetical protein
MNTANPIPPPTEVSPGASSARGDLPKQPVGGSHLIDLTGRRFGRWTVNARAENGRHRNSRWVVTCDCGETRIVSGQGLRSGRSTSCGCYKRERVSIRRLNSLTGLRFGRWLVLSQVEYDCRGAARWNVKCDCGLIRVVQGAGLRSGRSTSCGCYHSEVMAAQRGDQSPHWKPELTQEDRNRGRLGTSANLAWASLAQQIRKRDRATCLVCGEHGTHVHHLEPWALNRDLRYDPANLVTLCKECHNQFHYLYGEDADLEDFENFLLT